MTDEEANVAWLRREIGDDMAEARGLIEDPEVADEWVESSTGVLQTGAPDAADHWAGCWPTGNSYLSRHIARHDPVDVIADCEAKLAILDEHRLVLADRGSPEQGQSRGSASGYRIVKEHPSAEDARYAARMWQDPDCRACRVHYPCRTVRALASAYRRRPGYAEHWSEPAVTT